MCIHTSIYIRHIFLFSFIRVKYYKNLKSSRKQITNDQVFDSVLFTQMKIQFFITFAIHFVSKYLLKYVSHTVWYKYLINNSMKRICKHHNQNFPWFYNGYLLKFIYTCILVTHAHYCQYDFVLVISIAKGEIRFKHLNYLYFGQKIGKYRIINKIRLCIFFEIRS